MQPRRERPEKSVRWEQYSPFQYPQCFLSGTTGEVSTMGTKIEPRKLVPEPNRRERPEKSVRWELPKILNISRFGK